MAGLAVGWETLQRNRLLTAAIPGISLGLAYLANATAVYYLMFLVIMILAVTYKRTTWRSSTKGRVLMLALFRLLATPYELFLHQDLGKGTFTGRDVT